MDESSFDNVVRRFAVKVQSRRALATVALGLGLSLLEPLSDTADAARRRRGGRKRRRKPGKGNRGGAAKGSGSGKTQHGGRGGDCETPNACPIDPQTDKPGFICPDGSCSCGGVCCEKGYACFVDEDLKLEICCYDDPGATAIPSDADFAVCISDRDVCCDVKACKEMQCKPPEPGISPSRYRRNPR